MPLAGPASLRSGAWSPGYLRLVFMVQSLLLLSRLLVGALVAVATCCGMLVVRNVCGVITSFAVIGRSLQHVPHLVGPVRLSRLMVRPSRSDMSGWTNLAASQKINLTRDCLVYNPSVVVWAAWGGWRLPMH